MLAKLAQRLGRRSPAPAGIGPLGGQKLDRAVHANLEDIRRILEVGVNAFRLIGGLVMNIGAKAPEIGGDHAAIGMLAHFARQAEEGERLFKVHILGLPALGQASAGWLLVFLGGFAALNVRAKAPRSQADLIAAILAQDPVTAIGRVATNRAGIAALGVIATADKAAGLGGFQMQLAGAAKRALARIAAIFARRIERRREGVIQHIQHLGDPQIRGFGNRY